MYVLIVQEMQMVMLYHQSRILWQNNFLLYEKPKHHNFFFLSNQYHSMF